MLRLYLATRRQQLAFPHMSDGLTVRRSRELYLVSAPVAQLERAMDF